MRTTAAPAELRARAIAFALTARHLTGDVAVLHDEPTLTMLRAALDASGNDAAKQVLSTVDPERIPGSAELSGAWVRWCELGQIAPYEGSYVTASAGGITPRLADIAGFYRSFGMVVEGDRPDHLVAELEFLALALLHELEAIESGDDERRDVSGDVIRTFLRDHAGTWIDAWCGRMAEIRDLAPWVPFARIAALLVRREAADRNVIPVRSNAVLTDGADIADDGGWIPECGGDEPLDI